MRMMKNNNNETVMVIGIDHGYGNMKTATRCFSSGVARYDKEPIFQNNLLVYNGMYYQIGEEHKEFCAEKTQDEDYYVLTLAAIARELDGKGMNRATVHIAAGLPLTWVATQKEDFQKYLLQNECVDFTFRNKDYDNGFNQKIAYTCGEAWVIRILAIVAVLLIVVIIMAIIMEIIKKYKKMWDKISQMFLIGSLSGIAVLGDVIREYLPVNLILTFGFINVGIMLLKIYFQKKFEEKSLYTDNHYD